MAPATFVPGGGATASSLGAERDGAAEPSKPVTQLQRATPELLIIDFEREKTGPGLGGQTQA